VLTASITSSVTSFIGDHGVYAVFALMALDAVFPAASEVVMVYAGALAAGSFAGQDVVLFGWTIDPGAGAYLVMVAAGILGYQLGSIAGYGIGYGGGRPFLERYGRWLHLSHERLERAERWFTRWEGRAVFLGRITPVARSFVSIPAGLFRAPFTLYNTMTLAGNALWCFVFAGIGYGLGESYARFDDAFRYVEYVIVAGIVLGGALLVWRRRSTKLAKRAEHPSG
jgi:membrane protein DedA with SNARE-associated domain